MRMTCGRSAAACRAREPTRRTRRTPPRCRRPPTAPTSTWRAARASGQSSSAPGRASTRRRPPIAIVTSSKDASAPNSDAWLKAGVGLAERRRRKPRRVRREDPDGRQHEPEQRSRRAASCRCSARRAARASQGTRPRRRAAGAIEEQRADERGDVPGERGAPDRLIQRRVDDVGAKDQPSSRRPTGGGTTTRAIARCPRWRSAAQP